MTLVSGCGQKAAQPPFAADADRIACRIGSATAFEKVCAVERAKDPQGLILTLRHPDGGFRRLRVTGDGRGVIAADGAEPVRVTVARQGIEVVVGADAYRLPATVKSE